MKKLLIVSLLLLANITFSQEKKISLETNFESIEITVDSLEEIDTIKWDDFKDVFKENKPESMISMKVTVKNIKKENLLSNFSIGVNGKSEQIDSLVNQLKKGVLKMKQLIINLNEKNKK
ncbi:hypothetical protein [Polaribacter gangjinensis]|uniref:Uncharacterized protein n=1 Tax=Polaribacter gangjinensis TaxID=574710 RepID=A0A2S7WFD3_9FLAO|nr:hypothetical protein [Polaribacter gangjinensis]PQJ75952.1 hypothetical protein BTO13_12275 [Polaribacter gangjinensis]